MVVKKKVPSSQEEYIKRHADKMPQRDAVDFLSKMGGLSRAEIEWTFNRLKHLMAVEGFSKEEAKALVKQEAKAKPWNKK